MARIWVPSINDWVVTTGGPDAEATQEELDAIKGQFGKPSGTSQGLEPSAPPESVAPGTPSTPTGGGGAADIGSGLLHQLATPEAIGSVLGSYAGKSIPIPGASILTSALGAGSGEGITQGYQTLMGDENAPKSLDESMTRIRDAMVRGGISEGAASLLAATMGHVLSPHAARITAAAQQAEETMARLHAPRDLFLTAMQATDRTRFELMRNWAEGGMTGGATRKFFNVTQPGYLRDWAQQFAESIGPKMGRQDFGNFLLNFRDSAKEAAEAQADVLYKRVGEATQPDFLPGKDKLVSGPKGKGLQLITGPPTPQGGVWVDTGPIKSFVTAQDKLTQEELGGFKPAISGSDYLDMVNNLGPQISFESARKLRSILLSDVRTMEASGVKKAPSIGVAKQIIGRLQDSMDEAITKQAPGLKPVLDEANRLTRGMHADWNNELMTAMVRNGAKRDPGLVGDAIIANPANATAWMSKLDEPGRDKVRRYIWEDMANKARGPAPAPGQAGFLDGQKLMDQLVERDGVTPTPLAEATFRHSPGQFRDAAGLIQAMQAFERRPSSKVGQLAAQFMGSSAMRMALSGGIGAVFGGAGGHALSGAGLALGGTELFAPWMLGKILTDRRATRLFLRAFRTPPGTSEVAQAAIQGKLMDWAQQARAEKAVEDAQTYLNSNPTPTEALMGAPGAKPQ